MQPRAEVHAIHVGLFGDVAEGAVSVIPVEHVFPVLHHVEVGPAVVVVVSRCASQPISSARNSGLVGDIGERSVAVVSIKRIARL